MDKEEIIDQGAHFLIGLIAVVSIGNFVPVWVAFIIMISGALIRELWQHEWDIKKMGVGSWKDMGFWFLGGVIGILM